MRVRYRNPLAGLWGGPLAVLLGIAMLFFGWRSHAQTRAFVAAASHARGTVVEIVAHTRGSDTLFYPVVEFTTPEGQVVRFQDRNGSNPPAHRVGETVDVLYDPARPQVAAIASWKDLWLFSTILLGFGGLWVLLGVLAFLRSLFFAVAGLGGLLGLLAALLGRSKTKQQ